MQVRVLFFAVLAERLGTRELALELPPPATVGDALEALAERFPPLGEMRPRLAFAVNQEYARADTPLSDDDELGLIPPVSGG